MLKVLVPIILNDINKVLNNFIGKNLGFWGFGRYVTEPRH